MAVVIGGGTGFIGSHVRRKLASCGYEKIICISRSPGKDRMTWGELSRHGLPENCKAVVNLAGANLFWPLQRWTAEFKQELVSSRVETTRALARAIERSAAPPAVFVLVSAVGYYGTSATKEFTEDSPPAKDFFADLCVQNENATKTSLGDSLRTVVVRSGLPLGRDGGAMMGMYYPFFFGVGGRIGSGKQWFPWIHIADMAGIVVHAIESSHVRGVLNGVAPEPATNEQFTSAFARALWRPALLPVPEFVVRALLHEERARVVLEGQRVVPRRTLESGYKYCMPDLRSACADLSHFIYNDQHFGR